MSSHNANAGGTVETLRESLSPLLKWPGGKRTLAPRISSLLQGFTGRYYEPFCGGGAVFFALIPRSAVLGDVNGELICCYDQIRKNPRVVAAALSQMPNTKDSYYAVRASSPSTPIERAARFLYLTSLSFNGIYRQNLRGEFNVPYGFRENKKLATETHLLSFAETLRDVILRTGDFASTSADAIRGDAVYFDPPYTVAHNANGFVKYNASIFSWNDQRRLAEHATSLVKQGCRVVVSNADHPSIEELYQGFSVLKLPRASVIAASSDYRKQITECVFYSGGEE